MSNLYQASNQWAHRPEDERFETPEAMRDACLSYAKGSRTATVPFDALRLETQGQDLMLAGKTDTRALMTHYAFGQLCNQAKAPANFVRQLPPTLAMQVMNNRIKAVSEENNAKYDARLLFHANGNLVVRAVTSELYDRVWNYELLDRGIIPLIREFGWRVPPARPAKANQKGTRKATAADILPGQEGFGLSIKVGDDIAPAGLYASDHDMFAFIVHTDRVVRAGNRALMRGCFFRNSEVGDGSLEGTFFLLDNVCGNHICWGVENVHSIKIRHIAGKDKVDQGETLKRFTKQWDVEMAKYIDAGAQDQELKIAKAMSYRIGATKEEVIDTLFKYARTHSLPAITKKRLDAAYETAKLHEGWYGDPKSAWGMVSGLTENSQKDGYADERNDVDQQAVKVLEIAF